MSNKQELVDILKAKFKTITRGSITAETSDQTDDGNELALYNVGVIDVNSKGEFVGRTIRFYVLNEGHPKEIMSEDGLTGTGVFTDKIEEAGWLNGETPKTIIELEAEAAVIVPTPVDTLITYLDTTFDPNNYTLHPTIDIGGGQKAAVVTIPVDGVPTKMVFGTVDGQLTGRKFSE